MAEVLATMVVGPLVSMVKEKASSYLLDQYEVMEGMEEQHKLLMRKLPAILDVITDAEEHAAKNREGAKAWLEELRKVAYKANDVLDEFRYEALRRKAKKEGKEFGMDVIKLFPSHNRFVFRYRMAKNLRLILQEIDVLIAEMNTFRFKFKPQEPMSWKWRQTNPNIPDDSVNIASKSRSEEKQEIVDALLDQGGNVGLTVLPIVAMGGMGKTTLAQLVYNESVIQKHFQLRLWVCVSENFDLDSLADRIVKVAEASGCQVNGTDALGKLQNAVSGKRYLLVLDDVWNREAYKWEKLRSCLHHGGIGSSVVTTTRDKNVAQLMGTIKAHEIKDMNLNIIEEIIKTRAFGSQAEVPTEFKKLVGDIANKCKSSPLAATALGFVLRTKNTMQEWEAILSRNTICDEENGILPILKLSYNCLTPHMRQCFAFCAMFPKDHEIDVEMLIRLWMANCFIPEQQGVCPEVTGQQVFNELAQRSFFQEVKKAKFDDRSYWRASDPRYYYFRITCKIHDLMHDVAMDSMGKECATVDTRLKKSEDFPYTTRHLFLSVDTLENVLNASPEIGSLAIQTLICDRSRIEDVQHLSKCKSVRALKTQEISFLEPKYLHHLRYLDLSRSDIKAFPEDITILYHLQTLNLSHCHGLEQLPKAMKYMTALRHLYNHGCLNLKSMPPDLGHLTSLQTLACFVACTDLGCSNMGELKKLDLGGQLELRQLENATRADAKAANLNNKKRLEELTLRWTSVWTVDRDKEEKHKEVLKGLRPHDRLKAMRIYSYGSSAVPTWMRKLQGLVELELRGCNNLEKLPALWQLPALQFLNLCGVENLRCLFSGGAPSKFQKLKSMVLDHMPKFEMWWDTDEVQEEEPIFPEVENLAILGCGSLAALPKASVIKQSCGRDGVDCCSAFPALREMSLHCLFKFHRWEVAIEGTLVGQEQVIIFPQLEKLQIHGCTELVTFPEAPKLSTLDLEGCSQEASLQAASRYIASLSNLSLHASANDRGTTLVVVRDRDEPNHRLSLEVLDLRRCDLFFSQSSALALWKCFGQLARLVISECDSLELWPEKLFQSLVSLGTLKINRCSKLTGRMEGEACEEQSVAAEQSGGHLPRLESLEIHGCDSLAQVPNLSASIKKLRIENCANLKSIVFGQQEGMMLVSGEGHLGETSSSSLIEGSISEATVSTSVPELVSAAANNNHRCCFFPCLESLEILDCSGLTEVANFPPSIKTLEIHECGSLISLSGEVLSLEQLVIRYCKSLESLPDGQEYASLRVFDTYYGCIKKLPPSLQQRLNHLMEVQRRLQLGVDSSEEEELDSDQESMSEEASSEQQGLMSKLVAVRLRNKMKCFRSRSDE